MTQMLADFSDFPETKWYIGLGIVVFIWFAIAMREPSLAVKHRPAQIESSRIRQAGPQNLPGQILANPLYIARLWRTYPSGAMETVAGTVGNEIISMNRERPRRASVKEIASTSLLEKEQDVPAHGCSHDIDR